VSNNENSAKTQKPGSLKKSGNLKNRKNQGNPGNSPDNF
jgi:hypothetical protein